MIRFILCLIPALAFGQWVQMHPGSTPASEAAGRMDNIAPAIARAKNFQDIESAHTVKTNKPAGNP